MPILCQYLAKLTYKALSKYLEIIHVNAIRLLVIKNGSNILNEESRHQLHENSRFVSQKILNLCRSKIKNIINI